MTEADLARLQEIVTETERVTQAGDPQATIQAHTDFHYLIYTAGGNAELERVARNLLSTCPSPPQMTKATSRGEWQ
jgi:DNA-binding GntR family transcriptional regulator